MKHICLLLVTIFGVISCNTHAIENPATDYEILSIDDIETDELFNGSSCFWLGRTQFASSGIVIRNEEAYAAFTDSLRYSNSNDPCDTATLIDIDFNKYSLFGMLTLASACDTISSNLSVDQVAKTVTYDIDIKLYNGNCIDMVITSLNLVAVNKIPDDFRVEFNVVTQ